jgi:hypothetical protein
MPDMGGTATITPTPGPVVTIEIDTSAPYIIAQWTAGENETVQLNGIAPVNGQRIMIVIMNDNVAPRTITFGNGFSDLSQIVGAVGQRSVIKGEAVGGVFLGTLRSVGGQPPTAVASGAPGLMSGADKAKLDGVAAGATANASDATLLNRANHTGIQAQNTIVNLESALASKVATDDPRLSNIRQPGFVTGAGGVVTQATSKSTGVTLNKVCGEITLNAAALAAGAIVSFTLTNSTIAATDVIVINHVSGGTFGPYLINGRCANGSAVVTVRNTGGSSLSEAIVLRFAIIKGVTS